MTSAEFLIVINVLHACNKNVHKGSEGIPQLEIIECEEVSGICKSLSNHLPDPSLTAQQKWYGMPGRKRENTALIST